MSEDGIQFKTKICLLGDSMVGKTSLIRRYVMDRFSDEYISTLGTKVTKKQVNVDRADGRYEMTMMIWDVEGTREKMAGNIKDFNASLHPGYLSGSEGILLVFDLTRKETLDGVGHWFEGVEANVGKDIPFIMLANKCDLKKDQKVTEKEARDRAKELGFDLYFTSAKTGENVEEAFQRLGEQVLANIKK